MSIHIDIAIQAVENNDPEMARALLRIVLQEDPDNDMARLLLADLAESDEDHQQHLRQATQLHRDSDTARRTSRLIEAVAATPPVAPDTPEWAESLNSDQPLDEAQPLDGVQPSDGVEAPGGTLPPGGPPGGDQPPPDQQPELSPLRRIAEGMPITTLVAAAVLLVALIIVFAAGPQILDAVSGSVPTTQPGAISAYTSTLSPTPGLTLSSTPGLTRTPTPSTTPTPSLTSTTDTGGADVDTVIYPDTTKVLSEDTILELASISADQSVFIFDATTPQLEGLQPGEIIVGGSSEQAPSGFLRRVVSVEPQGGQVVVETEHATLEEAVEYMDLAFSTELSRSDVQASINAPGVALASLVPLHASEGFYITIDNVVLYDEDDDESTTDDQIVANGRIEFEPGFDFSLRIRNFRLTEVSFKQRVREKVSVKVGSNVDIVSLRKEKEIGHHLFHPITIWVPSPAAVPFPVSFLPLLVVNVGIDGSLSVGFETSASLEAELVAGLRYDRGDWSPIQEKTIDFDFQPPNLFAKVKAKAYAGPRLELLLYGFVGPHAAANAYLAYEAGLSSASSQPWCKLYGGLEALVGVRFRILTLVSIGYEAQVIDFRLPLDECDLPTFTPTPTTTSTGTKTPTPTPSRTHTPTHEPPDDSDDLEGVSIQNARRFSHGMIVSQMGGLVYQGDSEDLTFDFDSQGNVHLGWFTQGPWEDWYVIDGIVYAGEDPDPPLSPFQIIDNPLATAGFSEPWDIFGPEQPRGSPWERFALHTILALQPFSRVDALGAYYSRGFHYVEYAAELDPEQLVGIDSPRLGPLADLVRHDSQNRVIHLWVGPEKAILDASWHPIDQDGREWHCLFSIWGDDPGPITLPVTTTPTATPSSTPSTTPTSSPTPSLTPSTIPTSSPTPSPTPSLTPTATGTPTPSPTPSLTPTGTGTPTPSPTPSPTPTGTQTPTPPIPSATP